jgi:tRNA 2-thiouridine synthesizing protein D
MSETKTLTFAIMDPPYENARSTTLLRLLDIAVRRGHNVNVFAYEGAVYLPFALQKGHPNPAHGRNAEEENHVLPKDLIAAIMATAEQAGTKFDWVNCGMCVDERGADQAIPGVRRGSPADLLKMANESDNTLAIGTR